MTQTRWLPAYIGIGSNLKKPSQQVASAFEAIGNIPETRLVLRSSLYRSSPLGGVEQPDFVNAVTGILTRLDAHDLLAELKRIEQRRGRERDGPRWGPRVLDLDILVFASHVINEAGLTIPHAGIAERNFVLLPLLEIAPQLEIPGLGRLSSLPVNDTEPAIERIA